MFDVVLLSDVQCLSQGAKEFYETSSNKARTESSETAIKVDGLTQEAWSSHPNMVVVDNTRPGGMGAKLDWAFQVSHSVVTARRAKL